jgi:guanine nucleotide-binding protein subunit beta-2-like 1 protein
MALQNTFVGHTNAVTTLAFAYKACYLASGGKDGNILLWQIEDGTFIKALNHSHPINQVLFSKVMYWIAAATDNGIIIWDIVKDQIISRIQVLRGDDQKDDDEEDEKDKDEKKKEKSKKVVEKKEIPCLSIAWSKNGNFLYSGWADNTIRVYEVAYTQ